MAGVVHPAWFVGFQRHLPEKLQYFFVTLKSLVLKDGSV